MAVFKALGYILASITALGVVIATGLLSIVASFLLGIAAIGGFVITLVAVAIKDAFTSKS